MHGRSSTRWLSSLTFRLLERKTVITRTTYLTGGPLQVACAYTFDFSPSSSLSVVHYPLIWQST